VMAPSRERPPCANSTKKKASRSRIVSPARSSPPHRDPPPHRKLPRRLVQCTTRFHLTSRAAQKLPSPLERPT
jgi:hypothetical protein